MQILSDVYLVGSGIQMGMGLTHKHDCSVYLLKGKDGDLLIDSGIGQDPKLIDENIKKSGPVKNLKYLLITHVHADHCGGAHFFREKYGCQVGISELTAHILESGSEDGVGMDKAKAAGDYDLDYTFTRCKVDIRLKDGDEFNLGDKIVKCVSFPGHSIDTILFLVDGEDGRYLFSGDSLFSTGEISLLNLPGSNLQGYRENIEKLTGKDIDALFPAHFHFLLNRSQDVIDNIAEKLQGATIPPISRSYINYQTGGVVR